MVSNKNDNKALKSNDFLQQLLEDQLKESSSNSDDGDFFNQLVDEVASPPPVQIKADLKVIKNTEVDLEDKTTVLGSAESPQSSINSKQLSSVEIQKPITRDPLIDLKNVDYIKAAQEKVLKLDKEIMALRQENQELAVAGDHFKNLSEDQRRKIQSLEAELESLDSTFSEEKKILLASINAKELRIEALQVRVEDLEEQMQTKFNRLRMRERELESRLAIIKQENEAVGNSKDDMLVDLKRQVSELTEDLERSRSQYQKTLDKVSQRDDALRRTVKALKLSLTMLESHKQND